MVSVEVMVTTVEATVGAVREGKILRFIKEFKKI
jgi:hypothetical protein